MPFRHVNVWYLLTLKVTSTVVGPSVVASGACGHLFIHSLPVITTESSTVEKILMKSPFFTFNKQIASSKLMSSLHELVYIIIVVIPLRPLLAKETFFPPPLEDVARVKVAWSICKGKMRDSLLQFRCKI